MILKHLGPNKTFIGHIDNVRSDMRITSALATGDSSMTLTILGGVRVAVEDYLETDSARYVIKEATPDGDQQDVEAQLDLEDLEGIIFERYQAAYVPLSTALTLALTGTGWTAVTSVTKSRSVTCYKKTSLEVIKKLADAYLCEIKFDNIRKIVYMEPRFGSDRGVYFIRGLNLRKPSVQVDSYDYCTRIIPIGANDLRINDVNGGIGYVENYQYSSKIKPIIWTDSSYTVAADLKEDATAKLADMSRPRLTYSADVIDLASQSDRWSLLAYGLGDTVRIIDESCDIDDVQRIVKMTEYPRAPTKNTVELSNTVLTWEEMQARLKESTEAATAVLNSDGTVNGVYVHGISEDGRVIIETIIDESSTIQTLEETSVASVQVLYAVGTSPTVEPTEGWDTTAPTWTDGQYMWQKTLTTYADGTTVTSALTCITGATGSTGVSLTATYRYYKLATAEPTAPTGIATLPPAGWSDTEPGYTAGYNLYTVSLNVYSDGSYAYSGVNLSSSYKAATEARNLAANAQETVDAVKAHFWADDDGIHVTEIPQESYLLDPSGINVLITSEGQMIRLAARIMAAFTSSYARIGPEDAEHLDVESGRISIISSSGVQVFDVGVVAGGEGTGYGAVSTYPYNTLIISLSASYTAAEISAGLTAYVNGVETFDYTFEIVASTSGYSDVHVTFTSSALSIGDQLIASCVPRPRTFAFSLGPRGPGVVGDWSAVMGDGNMATAECAVAGGRTCKASGRGSVALGVSAHAASEAAVALGQSLASGAYSMAAGSGISGGAYSAAIGRDTSAVHDYQTAVGRNNIGEDTQSVAFAVGNGEIGDSPSDAFRVDWDGNLHLYIDDTADTDLVALLDGLGWTSDVVDAVTTGDVEMEA